jgi:hypothetical protein
MSESIEQIEDFVRFKLEQNEERFDRLINAGLVVEARGVGKVVDTLKSVLKKIEAVQRLERFSHD